MVTSVTSNISPLMTRQISQILRLCLWNHGGNYCQMKFFHALKQRSLQRFDIRVQNHGKSVNGNIYKVNKRFICSDNDSEDILKDEDALPHTPVLVNKVLEHLQLENGKVLLIFKPTDMYGMF